MKASEFLPWYRMEVHSTSSGAQFYSQIHDADFDRSLWDSPLCDTMEEAYALGRTEWLERCEVDREAAVAERTRRDDYVPPTQQQIAQNNAVKGY